MQCDLANVFSHNNGIKAHIEGTTGKFPKNNITSNTMSKKNLKAELRLLPTLLLYRLAITSDLASFP